MANWVTPTIYILMALVLLGLIAYIWVLRRQQEADSTRWKRIADQKYKEGRSEASQILRAAVDQITDDKSRMSGLSDRELMTETLLGLSALGRRMDRMEDSIHGYTQLDTMLASLTEQAELLQENARLLSGQMTALQNAASGFQSAVAQTDEAVYSLSDSAQSVDSLLTEISGQIEELTTFSSAFAELQNQISGVMLRTSQVLKATTQNPAAVLGQLDSRVTQVYEQLQNLSEGLNLMAESLEGVQDTLNAQSIARRAETKKAEEETEV